VARVQRGSHIILEQTCVGDGVWVPKRLEVRASQNPLLEESRASVKRGRISNL